jgi:hypothetical protein
MAEVVGPWPDPEVPDIDADGLMVPPWVKYPNLPKRSMGWRMGQGEHYKCDRYPAWWSRQTRPIRLQVRAKYPEPEEWVGYYQWLSQP